MDIDMIPRYSEASLDHARDDLKIFLDAKKEMNEIEYKEEVLYVKHFEKTQSVREWPV